MESTLATFPVRPRIAKHAESCMLTTNFYELVLTNSKQNIHMYHVKIIPEQPDDSKMNG